MMNKHDQYDEVTDALSFLARRRLYVKIEESLKNKRKRALAVLGICRRATTYLRDSLAENKVSYATPYVTYKQKVDWDWNAGKFMKPIFSDSDLEEESQLDQTIDQYIAAQSDVLLNLHYLSNTRIDYWIGCQNTPIESIVACLNEANKQSAWPLTENQHKADLRSIEEIDIPAFFENCSDLSFDSLKKIGISPIFTLWNLSDVPIGGLFFRFHPIIVEPQKKRAYYPIEVGILYFLENLDQIDWDNWISRSAQAAWHELMQSMDSHLEELNDPSFTFKETITTPKNIHPGEIKPDQLKKMEKGILHLQDTVTSLDKKMDDLSRSTVNLGKHHPKVKNSKRQPNTRERKVLNALDRKGINYCKCLDAHQTPPPGFMD